MRRVSTSSVMMSPSRTSRDRAAARRLGRDVADHEAVRRAGEAPVGDQRDVLAEPCADERRRSRASISRMPGPPSGPS